jgi:hypothetical protein
MRRSFLALAMLVLGPIGSASAQEYDPVNVPCGEWNHLRALGRNDLERTWLIGYLRGVADAFSLIAGHPLNLPIPGGALAQVQAFCAQHPDKHLSDAIQPFALNIATQFGLHR